MTLDIPSRPRLCRCLDFRCFQGDLRDLCDLLEVHLSEAPEDFMGLNGQCIVRYSYKLYIIIHIYIYTICNLLIYPITNVYIQCIVRYTLRIQSPEESHYQDESVIGHPNHHLTMGLDP